MHGPPTRKRFATDVAAIQVNILSLSLVVSNSCPDLWRISETILQNHSFYNLGRYMVMSVAQEENGFPFLAEPVYAQGGVQGSQSTSQVYPRFHTAIGCAEGIQSTLQIADAPNSGLTRYSGHSSMHGLISLKKTPD